MRSQRTRGSRYSLRNRILIALIALLFGLESFAHGQRKQSSLYNNQQSPEAEYCSPELAEKCQKNAAARAIAALNRLDKHVLVYESRGEFEASGTLSRVPLETFKDYLKHATAEVEMILPHLPQGRLKTHIANALASYRDGTFWWGKIDHPLVVNISTLSFEKTRTHSDAVFMSTVPYTIAIHWRHARKSLHSAERLISRPRPRD